MLKYHRFHGYMDDFIPNGIDRETALYHNVDRSVAIGKKINFFRRDLYDNTMLVICPNITVMNDVYWKIEHYAMMVTRNTEDTVCASINSKMRNEMDWTVLIEQQALSRIEQPIHCSRVIGCCYLPFNLLTQLSNNVACDVWTQVYDCDAQSRTMWRPYMDFVLSLYTTPLAMSLDSVVW